MFEYIERKTGYTKDELTSSCRKQELCLVRHAHWYLLRKKQKNNIRGYRWHLRKEASHCFNRNKKLKLPCDKKTGVDRTFIIRSQ